MLGATAMNLVGPAPGRRGGRPSGPPPGQAGLPGLGPPAE